MKKPQRRKVAPHSTVAKTPRNKEDEPKTKASASKFGARIVDLTNEYDGQGFQIIGGVRPPFK
jgi:hypothetical protein